MDGSFTAPTEVSPAHPVSYAGILYAEDFDDPAEPECPPAPVEPPPPVVVTQADVDAACAAAVQAARREWQADQERHRQETLSALGRAVADLRDTAEQVSLAATEGTVATILSIVCGLLPHHCRNHGDAEVRALIGRLLPTIRSGERITVRLHPDLVATVQRDLAGTELAGSVDILGGAVERGDVKVSWESGTMTRDTKQILQAVQDALGQLGLHLKLETPAKRSMAYAE